MRIKASFIGLLLCVLGLGLVAAPAQATDAQIKKVIKQQEAKLKPMLEDFEKAGDAIEGPEDFAAVQKEVTKLRKGLTSYRKALAKVSGSTADGKKAKTKLLAAIKEMDRGFEDFEEFLEKAGEGASTSELSAAEKAMEKRFDKAEKLEDQALKLLGLPADD